MFEIRTDLGQSGKFNIAFYLFCVSLVHCFHFEGRAQGGTCYVLR